MRVSVYDTYVTRKDGRLMHFDILVEEGTSEDQVHRYGKMYLTNKRQGGLELTAKQCHFCHIEKASAEIENQIIAQGYYIIEMQGCV